MPDTEPSFQDTQQEVLDLNASQRAPVKKKIPKGKNKMAESTRDIINGGNRAAKSMGGNALEHDIEELKSSDPKTILGKAFKEAKIKALQGRALAVGVSEAYSDIKIEKHPEKTEDNPDGKLSRVDKASNLDGWTAKVVEDELLDAARELRNLADDIGAATGLSSMMVLPVIMSLIEAGSSVPEEYNEKSGGEIMADRVNDLALKELVGLPKLGSGGKLALKIEARMEFKEAIAIVANKMEESFENESMKGQSHNMSPEDYKVAQLSAKVNCSNAGHHIARELKKMKKRGQIDADGTVTNVTLRIPDGKGGVHVEKFDKIDLKNTRDVALLTQSVTGRDLGARMNEVGVDKVTTEVGEDLSRSIVGIDSSKTMAEDGKANDGIDAVKAAAASFKPNLGGSFDKKYDKKEVAVKGSACETEHMMMEMFAEAKITPQQVVDLLGLRDNQSLDPETMVVETKNADGTTSKESVESHIQALPEVKQQFLNEGIKRFKEIADKNAAEAKSQEQGAETKGADAKPKGQYDVAGMRQKIRDAALRGEDVSNLVMQAMQNMAAAGMDPASMKSFGDKAINLSKDVQAKNQASAKEATEKTAVDTLKEQEAKAKEAKNNKSQSAEGQGQEAENPNDKKAKSEKAEEEKKKKAKKSKLATLVSKLSLKFKTDRNKEKLVQKNAKLAAMKSMKIHGDKQKNVKLKDLAKGKAAKTEQMKDALAAAKAVTKDVGVQESTGVTNTPPPISAAKIQERQGNQRQ